MKQEPSLLQMLSAYTPGKLPMHMPGHKRQVERFPYLAPLGGALDLTEVDGFDNLAAPEGILASSMRRAAKVFGAERTFYLVNGSTVGILAGVHALLPRGGRALAARNSHISLFHALALRGASVSYMEPRYGKSCALSVDAQTVYDALKAAPDTKLVAITSPTYEGVISDIAAIAEAAHAFGAYLLVDEAHGAHLDLSPFFMGGAVRAGADIVVQSLHKTLPSLTQTAAAHVKGEETARRFSEKLAYFQTTSPSYLMLASMDGCVRTLENEGEALFSGWHGALEAFYGRVESLKRLHVPREFQGAWKRDLSKISVDTSDARVSGGELAALLRKWNIEPEMAAGDAVLLMTSPGDGGESLNRLADALFEMDGFLPPAQKEAPPILPPLCPVCALDEGEEGAWREIAWEKAEGRTAAEYVMAYPPGVPALVPGCRITKETLQYARAFRGRLIHSRAARGVAVL